MKTPIRFLAMLFGPLLLVVGDGQAYASGFGPPPADTVRVDLSSPSVSSNSTATVTVTVTRRNGTPEADGTVISATVSPSSLGTIAGVGSGGAASGSTSSLIGGVASFVFIAGNYKGVDPATATITVSLPPSNGYPNTVVNRTTIKVTSGGSSNSSLQVTPNTATLPQNRDNIGPYLGSPYMAELKVQWTGLISGQPLNGKVNVAISPVGVAAFSTLDDPSTPWVGQTKNPPTAEGNEFLTLLGSGTVNVVAGVGTIFVSAGDVPGTATLTVSALDPETNRTLSAQPVTITVNRVRGGMPGAVTLSQSTGGVYINGGNGPQSKTIKATVVDGGGSAVDDPDFGTNNVQFQIIGPMGTDATLYSMDASGTIQSGSSVKTATRGGAAYISLLAGSVQGPVQIKATVDGFDGNIDNGITAPISATTTVIVSDGQLYSLTITSPKVNAVAVNGVTASSPPGGTVPTQPDATYSLTVSAIATDRQGNPVPAGTPILFGVIDTPQDPNFLSSCNGFGAFQICGWDGTLQPGSVYFSAPEGGFRTAGGGTSPGDKLIVLGKQKHGAPAGNDDFESAVGIIGVQSETQLITGFPFNLSATTSSSTLTDPLPYVVGRATIGNINSPAMTDSLGRATVTGTASTTLNYPVSQLNRGVVIWAQGLSTNPLPIGGTRIVTDAMVTVYPSLAEPSITASPNPVPGNLPIPMTVCVVDALRIPIPGVRFNFNFSNLGAGSGSVDGHTNSGWTDDLTDASCCLVVQVKTAGIASATTGGSTAAPTLTFNVPFSTAPSAAVAVPITAGGNLILLATPSVLGGSGGSVTLTLLSANGVPVANTQLSGSCTGDTIGLSSPPGVTNVSGVTSAAIIANLDGYGSPKSGSCTFTTPSGSPTVTVNLKGTDLCAGVTTDPRCPGYVAPKPVTVNMTISSVNGSSATASLSSQPGGLSCNLSNGTTQSCSATPAAGNYTLTATPVSPSVIVGFTGDCQSSGGNTATLSVPAATATAQTLTCNLQVSGGALTSPVKGNITIQSNNGKTATASISSAPGGVACSLTGLTQNCTSQLAAGTSYGLTASVSSGTTVVGWAGDCSGTGNTANLAVPATGVTQVSCTLVVNGPGTVATVPVAMTIKSDNAQSVIASVTGFANGVSCNIAGTSQSCTPQVDPASSPVTLTGVITAGRFVGWSGDCQNTTPPPAPNVYPTTVTATLAVPANASSLSCTLIISGTQPGLLPVTINLVSINNAVANAYVTSDLSGINQGNCSLSGTSSSCSVLLQSGQTYTLTPNPIAGTGTTIIGWSGDCIPVPGNPNKTATLNMSSTRASFACTLTVTGPAPIPANFTIQSDNGNNASVSINSSPNGASCSLAAAKTQTCPVLLQPNSVYTLTALPSSGTIVNWTGDCVGSGSSATLSVPTTVASPLSCILHVNGP